MITFQITFNDLPKSDAVWMAAQKRIEKLDHFFNRIIRCEVIISCPHRHQHADRLYHVQIHVMMPRDHIVVNRNTLQNKAHCDVYVALRDAFDAAERILKDKVKKSRHKVKFHKNQYEEGIISKIFYHDGYGFLNANNGREFYFGENCITNENFNRLKVGQKVKFLEEHGEKGPQITSMAVI